VITDKRPRQEGRSSSSSIRSYTGADKTCHLKIDHDLYNSNHYYSRLVNCWVRGAVQRFDVLHLHFRCRNGCCQYWPPRHTFAYLLYQVWLDYPGDDLLVYTRVEDLAA